MKSLKFDPEDGDINSPRKPKLEENPQKVADMMVTDEDFVPLELFDGVLGEFQHKF